MYPSGQYLWHVEVLLICDWIEFGDSVADQGCAESSSCSRLDLYHQPGCFYQPTFSWDASRAALIPPPALARSRAVFELDALLCEEETLRRLVTSSTRHQRPIEIVSTYSHRQSLPFEVPLDWKSRL